MFFCNDKYLPDYPVADTTPFVDNGYQTDSVTLIGYLRNLPSTRPFEVSVPDMITDREEKIYHRHRLTGKIYPSFPCIEQPQRVHRLGTYHYLDIRRAGRELFPLCGLR